jgi:signal transduction histidine kinase
VAWATFWLAEQAKPVRRKVALKIIKAGMNTSQVVARFEAERQALALMDHPAIALTVAGDGRGFSPAASKVEDAGFGLRSLAARSRLIGATLRIRSAPGRGTTVVVEVPVNPTGENRHAG